jgi:hypothetical protein
MTDYCEQLRPELLTLDMLGLADHQRAGLLRPMGPRSQRIEGGAPAGGSCSREPMVHYSGDGLFATARGHRTPSQDTARDNPDIPLSSRADTGAFDMKVYVEYTWEIDDGYRAAINHYTGIPGLATRYGVQRWFQSHQSHHQ